MIAKMQGDRSEFVIRFRKGPRVPLASFDVDFEIKVLAEHGEMHASRSADITTPEIQNIVIFLRGHHAWSIEQMYQRDSLSRKIQHDHLLESTKVHFTAYIGGVDAEIRPHYDIAIQIRVGDPGPRGGAVYVGAHGNVPLENVRSFIDDLVRGPLQGRDVPANADYSWDQIR